MTLHQTIKGQIKEAMLAKDALRLGVVRGLVSSFTNELVALKRTPQDELSDEEVLAVIRRAVKQRKDSIDQFTKGGRLDLAEPEQAELAVLEAYLPAQMSREDVVKVAQAKMLELGITAGTPDKSAVGKFMGALMRDLKGNADGDTVKSVVEDLLTK